MGSNITLTTQLALTKRGINKVINTVPEFRENQHEPLFSTEKTREREYEVRAVSGFGFAPVVPEAGEISNDKRFVLYTPTYIPVNYVLAFEHTKQTEFQDIYGENMKDAALARDALFETRERNAQLTYVDGFTVAGGGDSLALFHIAHTTGGGPTYSNRPASDLSLSSVNVEQGRAELRKVKDRRNMARKVRGPVYLIVPPDLEYTARAIENSELTPENANTRKNVVNEGLRTKVLDYMSDTNDWVLQMQDKTRHSLFVVNRMPITSETEGTIKILAKTTAVYEEYIHGWVHAYGTWGTAPS